MVYTFLAGAVSPPLPHLRKARTVIQGSAPPSIAPAPRSLTRPDPSYSHRFENWIGRIVPRAVSPTGTHADLVEMGLANEIRFGTMQSLDGEEVEGEEEEDEDDEMPGLIAPESLGVRQGLEPWRDDRPVNHIIPTSGDWWRS